MVKIKKVRKLPGELALLVSAGVGFLTIAAASAPVITVQPVSRTVTTKQTALFSVTAAGTAPLSYQWQKKPSLDTFSNIPGAKGASCSPALQNGVQFRCLVSNGEGAAASNPAKLTVTSPAGNDDTVYLVQDSLLLVMSEKVLYKRPPQEDMYLYILRPKTPAANPLSAIVYFTGGGWVNGYPTGMINNAAWHRDHGIIGISADYRVQNRHGTTPIECVKDAKSAIRFVRAHAAALGIDPRRIIAAGGSAGGHLAANTQLPGNEEPGEDTAISSKPNGLELHNPVLGSDFGLSFFQQHPECSPILGVCKGWPPAIVANGDQDPTTYLSNARLFVNKMTDSGNICRLITVAGAAHSCDWPVTNVNFLPTITAMRTFLANNGLITTLVPAVAPAITTQPVNQTVSAGSPAIFMAAATGTAASYQWQKKIIGGSFSDIPGAVSPRCTTMTAMTENGSQFRCVISNNAGIVVTDAATLSVTQTAVARSFRGAGTAINSLRTAPADVRNISGRTVAHLRCDQNGQPLAAELKSLPAGVYIVRTVPGSAKRASFTVMVNR